VDVVKFSTTMFQMGNVNGYEYRSTVAPMGGKYLLPFSADRREDSGIRDQSRAHPASAAAACKTRTRRIAAVVAKLEG
jgi:hypothetical protein